MSGILACPGCDPAAACAGSMAARGTTPQPTTLRSVTAAWLPLAASWMLMSLELPGVAAVIARLENPETHLAAYGSVVFPIALIVEAPIIMLLAASTALSRDHASYDALRRFTHRLSFALTCLHALLAFTPLFDVVVPWMMDVPPQVIEPARLGMKLMIPWTWPIAYRRFCQGVLIRYGYSAAITKGTMLRLLSMSSVLAIGLTIGDIPGVALGASAVISGVVAEAAYAGWRVRAVVREHLSPDAPSEPPLRGRAFLNFYVPLGMTSLITLIAQPMCSAAMGRMPEELPSLALWPVIIGLTFMLQALGIAYNEVVVSMLERPGARDSLYRFTLLLSGATAALIVLLAATPLSEIWLADISGLPPDMVERGRVALWLSLPIPAMRGLCSWYQGVLVHARATAPITESVVIYIIVAAAVLAVGIQSLAWPGIYVGVTAYSIGRVIQAGWLWWRSREAVAALS